MGFVWFMLIVSGIYEVILSISFAIMASEGDKPSNVKTRTDLLLCFIPFGFFFVQIRSLWKGLEE